MSVTCKTCTHPAKEEIDKALLAGQPYRSVARQYEASPPSVYRHKQDHLPASVAALPESVTFPVHLQDVYPVRKAVQERAGQPFRTKDLSPLVEGQVGGDQS